VRKLLGLFFGLSLLMPTLHWEANLFTRVTAALDNGPALSGGDLHPPFDPSALLDKLK
jgi:hypothetical protein